MNETSGDSSSEDGNRTSRSRAPPAAMDLPLVNPSSKASSLKIERASTMPAKPVAALGSTADQTIRPGVSIAAPSTPPRHHEGMFGGIRDAWDKELAAERAEAKEEADQGWPASIRALLAEQKGNAAANGGTSTPGTPGGSRIRFDLASNNTEVQQPSSPTASKKALNQPEDEK